MALVPDLLRVVEIDRIDLEKREITLAFLRGADRSLDRISGLQLEFADLGRGNIDVVRAGKIVRFRRAKEAEAVLQDFDDAFADDLDLLGGQLFEDREHQLLFAQDGGVFDAVLLRKCDQFGSALVLQVLKFHVVSWINSREGWSAIARVVSDRKKSAREAEWDRGRVAVERIGAKCGCDSTARRREGGWAYKPAFAAAQAISNRRSPEFLGGRGEPA